MSATALAALLFTMANPAASVPSRSPSVTPAAPTLATKDASDIGRFEILDGIQSTVWLDERFREAIWRNDAVLRELNSQIPRTLKEYLRSSDYSTVKQALALSGSWKSGDAMHKWVFDEPDVKGGMIVRALELQDLSSTSGYHIRAIVHCYDEPENCKAFRDRQMPLLAPKPVIASGDLAQRQWKNRVNAETCTVFAKNMRQPQYPEAALRNGIEGSVMVGIFFNICGNVRDAWVQQSSGNRELDRAAVTNALKWQIDMQYLPKTLLEPGHAVVPVRFLLGDEPAMESSTVPNK